MTNQQHLLSQIRLIESLLVFINQEQDQEKRDRIEGEIYRIRKSITQIQQMTITEKGMKCKFLIMTVQSRVNA
jgi:hypothetical protein